MHDHGFDPYQPPEAAVGDSSGVALDVPPFNPWLTIWSGPRRTIRYLLDTEPKRHVLLLAMLSGVGWLMMGAIGSDRSQVSMGQHLLEVFVGGPLLGVFLVYLVSAAIRWTGKWIGGRGTYPEIRAAMAWAGVTLIPVIVIGLIAIPILGESLFRQSSRQGVTRPELFAYLILSLIKLLLLFWYIFQWARCVGEAHRFSSLKAIGAAILALLVWECVFLIIYGVAYLVGLSSP